MHSSGYGYLRPALGGLAILTVSALAGASAADAHRGVRPQPGEIVLLRNVSARQAVRPAPPGIALIVDPSPGRELQATLGTGELSDDEYATIGSSVGGAVLPTGQIAGTVNRAIGPRLAALGGGADAPAGPGTTTMGGNALGMVGATTRGLGTTLQGALSQFPLSPPATPGR